MRKQTELWGFHLHQELPLPQFAEALVIQEACYAFLTQHGVLIEALDAFRPGYGPHVNHMWELRVEQQAEQALELMGLAISFLCLNRFGLSANIHPLMHDRELAEDLINEGTLNQANQIWFGQPVEQNQQFFFNPPRDEENNIIDTRIDRILSESEKQILRKEGRKIFRKRDFLNPFDHIQNGFHLHMDFLPQDETRALSVFDNFVTHLQKVGMRPTSTRIYNGGWEVKFKTTDRSILSRIGIAIGWLMCNRQDMPVFILPVTWKEGDHQEELRAHTEHSFFIGQAPPLRQNPYSPL